MSDQEFKEKINWSYVVTGITSAILTLAVVGIIVVCYGGFRYRNIVLLNPEQVVEEEVQSTISIPEAELLTQMRQKGILMTPDEYMGHLVTYYDTLVAFLAIFFVLFSIVGYWGVRSISRKEVAQIARDVVADSYELRNGIKTMIMGEIDENFVQRDDYEQVITSIRESLDDCVYVEHKPKKETIIDPEKPKKNGSKRKKSAVGK